MLGSTGEVNDSEVGNISADIAFNPDIAYMTLDHLRARPQECIARRRTRFQPVKE